MVRRKELDEGLEQLKVMLLEMGNIVETVLGEAMQALAAVDVDKAKSIIKE